MTYEFSEEEFKEMVQAARIYGGGISEAGFHDLIQMQKHLDEPGYLGAYKVLARLEEEGIPGTKMLEEYQSRQKQILELEQSKSTALQTKVQNLAETEQQTQGRLEQNRGSYPAGGAEAGDRESGFKRGRRVPGSLSTGCRS